MKGNAATPGFRRGKGVRRLPPGEAPGPRRVRVVFMPRGKMLLIEEGRRVVLMDSDLDEKRVKMEGDKDVGKNTIIQ